MKWFNWRNFIGIGLILLGGLFLLQQLEIIQITGKLVGLLIATLFATGGKAFLSVVFHNRQQWWAVIPGMALLSIATVILLGTLAPHLSEFGGTVFMAGFSLAFWLVFYLSRQNWWAIIPAGALLTIAVMTAIPETSAFEKGSVFFFGLALTFALLALLPAGEPRMSWPWIPAAALLVIGILVATAATELIGYALPVALIALGLFLIVRSLIPKRA
ncbi:MAG: hypothetical protein U1B80_09355 [Anaerolineaceae bacterium]|nr:hypothetical protein [Anaerolineaceae bacterium]